jgi:hypothetical protein
VGASLIAKEHCKTCIESHWQRVFSELKMKLEVEHTDEGCIMRISKREALKKQLKKTVQDRSK